MDDEKWKGTGYADVSKALASVGGCCWFAALACLVIPAWQTFIWLKFASWQPITVEYGFLRAGIDVPWSSWSGVQAIITWWLAQSLAAWLAAALFAVGMLFLWLGALADGAERSLRQKWSDNAWVRKRSGNS